MPTYSSDKFYRDWRFSLERDFHTPTGEDYPYAQNGHREWGDETFKISAPDNEKDKSSSATPIAVSDDGAALAVGRGCSIDIYNLDDFSKTLTLHGHTDSVNVLAFKPGTHTQLVSAASNDYASPPCDPTIILWDTLTYRPDALHDAETIAKISREAADSVVRNIKLNSSTSVLLTGADSEALEQSFTPAITQMINKKASVDVPRIYGKLVASFQSHVFSPSGHALLYVPVPADGHRLQSNDRDEGWVINVHSVEEKKDMYTLVGHVDAIMWTGFSPDESMIGSVCWDKSIKIWNANDGTEKFTFETQGQNWTGGFSADSQQFVGTTGDGTVAVYELCNGSNIYTFNNGRGWYRALSWHPSGTKFALGGDKGGSLRLIDITKIESFEEADTVVQYRQCNAEKWRGSKEAKRLATMHLEVYTVKFVDDGRKIVFFTSGDGSAEIYDIEKSCKWRFARTGTENAPDNDEEVTSRGGFKCVVWENPTKRQLGIVTRDGDNDVRIWVLPLDQE